MIKIIDATHRPIQKIGQVAGICYNSNTEDTQKNYNRGLDCIESNHNRTFEYVDVVMEIDGYSNRVIRQLYTHIVGVTRLQESTRYVNMAERFEDYYIPSSIKKNPEALEAYIDTMWVLQNAYEFLIEHGIPKEDAGNLVPLGQHTKIVLKINLEALFHMFANRTCTRALGEFRELMNEMRGELSKIDVEWEQLCKDYFVTKCAKSGFCMEKKTCGRYPNKPSDQDTKVYTPSSKPLHLNLHATEPTSVWKSTGVESTPKLTGIDAMPMISNIIGDAIINSSPNVVTSTCINQSVDDIIKIISDGVSKGLLNTTLSGLGI